MSQNFAYGQGPQLRKLNLKDIKKNEIWVNKSSELHRKAKESLLLPRDLLEVQKTKSANM